MGSPALHVTLECELPAELAVGAGTALFVCGWCVCPSSRIRALELGLDDEPPRPVAAARMPRLDPLRELHPDLAPRAITDPDSELDPLLQAYRSGFWGLLTIPGPRSPATVEVVLHAQLADGQRARATVHRLRILDPPGRPASPGPRPPQIVVAMAAHDPPEDLLVAQLDSIRAQSHRDWTCVISDDCSGPEGAAALRRAVADDDRFAVSRAPRRLGFYANFERALSLVPCGASFVALADQDDVWHPDKLTTLLRSIGDAPLVHSDARVVARDGALVSPTWWSRREVNHDDLLALLVANSVTGAASLMRADLLDDALPFPPAQFAHFHDHWLGLVARARGELAWVGRPLWDYVQHDGASLGHARANAMPTWRERLTTAGELRERVAMWRLHYFADVWRLRTLAAILELRLDGRLDRRTRRALRRLAVAERSLPALAALATRGARDLTRARPRTLGAEWMLAHALAWRRLLAVSARERPQRRLRLDALPPTTLRQSPGARGPAGPPPAVRRVQDKLAPLAFSVSAAAPPRVNVLIPTIDLRHLFAGYIAKFNLAARLADHGARVRVVTTDPVGALAPDHRRRVEAYAGLAGLWDRVELVFGREASAIEVSPADRFVATTWWTAHLAAAASSEPFLYLIQEYEPFTFPAGTWAALARASYDFEHRALFSSELLRDYFRAHRIGVYRDGEAAGGQRSRSFENAITDLAPPTLAGLGRDGPRRLLFYARPEEHAARNMFELGVLALSRAWASGALGGWELHGIGTVAGARTLALGGGATLALVPRIEQHAYAEVLRAHDVGLALMDTPHPSLVPIEMAAAGMVTVTSTFENKTPAALAAISSNLVGAPPTPDGVVAALLAAAARVDDLQQRVAGSDVRWSRRWADSLPDELLEWALSAR